MGESQKRFNLDNFIPKGNQIAGYLEALYEAKNNQSLPNEYHYVITLLEMYLFANVTFVQCFAYERAYSRAKTDWERSTCLSLFDIVTGEGITYLCGYDKETQNGTKYAKLKQNMPDGEYKTNILALCEEYISYAKKFGLFVGLQDDKNITKHYDSDYLKITYYLTNIHSDTRYNRNNTFLSLLSNLTDCIAEYFEKEQVIIPINEEAVSCEDSRTLLLETMLMEDSSIARIYKQISQNENCMSRLIELENIDQLTSDLQRCGMLSEERSQSIKSQMQNFLNYTTTIFHIRKVHLDINYAIKSYFESTEHFERQANVYRMMIALYGGYTKLYGISNVDCSTSLFGKLHKPINDCRDNNLLTAERSIKRELNTFQSTIQKYEDKRNYMTHNKDGRKDKILDKYYYLCTLSPTEIVTDCNQFLAITQPLIRITDDILKFNYPHEWKSFKESKR